MGRKKRREKLLAAGPQDLVVEALDRKGLGMGHRDGRTVRVFGTLPGERIRYQPRERRRGTEEGPLVEILEAAPERIEPGCPHFGTCGGCTLQHLGSEDRMARAQRDLSELFAAQGVEPETWDEPLVGAQWGYRRKARLGVKRVEGKGRVLVGFRETDKRFVADLETCPVLASPVDRLLRPLGDMIDRLSIVRRLPQVEVAVGDDTTALILRVLDPPSEGDVEVLRAFESEHGVRIYLQSGGPDTVAPLDGGDPALHYSVAPGVSLSFLPIDFIQVNASLNEAMIARAIDWLELPSAETLGGRAARVLDLFCGLGNFTIPLARAFQSTASGEPRVHVHGVEGDAGLVSRGRANAQALGLAGLISYQAADLYGSLADVPLETDLDGAPWDRILLDPPRSGAEAVAHRLCASVCPRVVYVACGPEALARDAAILVREGGYRMVRASVMDMFPQTGHYESIACFVAG